MISTIIITNNNEDKIKDCLESVKNLSGEILVIDGGSTDKTVEIAKKYGARIIGQRGKGYSSWRNQGLKEAKDEWIFYLDSDERATPELKDEIKIKIKDNCAAFAVPRRNIILGREMRHGGWWPDYVKRLFRKHSLKKWVGDLHEEPVFNGEMGHLKNPLIHLKHDNLSEMVEKTNQWSEIEAKLLLDSGHPKMSWWRFFRIMKTEFFYRFFIKLGFLDGTVGIIYAIYQMWSKFITYAKLWEMQRKVRKT